VGSRRVISLSVAQAPKRPYPNEKPRQFTTHNQRRRLARPVLNGIFGANLKGFFGNSCCCQRTQNPGAARCCCTRISGAVEDERPKNKAFIFGGFGV